MYCLFCVVLCIVCVYMCTVLLPPGGYPIAVKYIISYLQLCTVAQYYHRKRAKEPLQPSRHPSLRHVATDAAAPELLSQSVRFYALFVGGIHPHFPGQHLFQPFLCTRYALLWFP